MPTTTNMGSTTDSLAAVAETNVVLLLSPLPFPPQLAATLIDYTQAAISRHHSGIHLLSISIISNVSSTHVSQGIVVTKTTILKGISL